MVETEVAEAIPQPGGATAMDKTQCLSFATDLLGSFEAVKKKNQRTVWICEELVSMVKHRAAAEEDYARSLQRVAGMSESLFADDEEEGPESTFLEGVAALRADLLKKGTQHTLLAQQLTGEVLDPLTQFRNQIVSQSKDLNDRAGALSKAARQLEGAYRSSHSRFERAYQHAASCCSAIIDLGATPPKAPDPAQVARKHGFDRIARMQAAQLHGSGGKEEQRLLKSLTSNTASTAANLITQVAKTDLTSWLLPNESERLRDLVSSARESQEAAEVGRFHCRQHYEALTRFAKMAAHKLQVVLSEFQLLEERCVEEVQALLRKHIVVESSAVANQQYDLQMIFKLLEDISADADLHAFITSTSLSEKAAAAAEKPDAPPCPLSPTGAPPSAPPAFPELAISTILSALSITGSPLPPPPPGFGDQWQPIEDPAIPLPRFPVVRPDDLLSLPTPLDSSSSSSSSSPLSSSSSSSRKGSRDGDVAQKPDVSPCHVAPADVLLRLLAVSPRNTPSPSDPSPLFPTVAGELLSSSSCTDADDPLSHSHGSSSSTASTASQGPINTASGPLQLLTLKEAQERVAEAASSPFRAGRAFFSSPFPSPFRATLPRAHSKVDKVGSPQGSEGHEVHSEGTSTANGAEGRQASPTPIETPDGAVEWSI